VACIILSASIVEVHLSYLGGWKNSNGATLIEELELSAAWEALRERRNMLIHGEKGSEKNDRLPSQEYRHEREKYQKLATASVYTALKVALNNPEDIS